MTKCNGPCGPCKRDLKAVGRRRIHRSSARSRRCTSSSAIRGRTFRIGKPSAIRALDPIRTSLDAPILWSNLLTASAPRPPDRQRAHESTGRHHEKRNQPARRGTPCRRRHRAPRRWPTRPPPTNRNRSSNAWPWSRRDTRVGAQRHARGQRAGVGGNGDRVDEQQGQEHERALRCAAAPIRIATIPAMHMNSTMARCRPKRMAASLPMMLDGMARTAAMTLTVIGSSSAEPPLRATT